ncbi:MAG: hypothetical protein AAGI48_09125 [Verrucomicrobiota bacterium]
MFRWIWLLLVILPLTAEAMVWQEGATPQKEPEGEMRQVGKVLYSPLKVFGGSCVAIGGKWVMTSRHGTDKWKPRMLHVTFPALADTVYEVKEVHFPKSGDLAMLELKKKVRGADELELAVGVDAVGKRVWLGGFGMSGPVGKVGIGGRFRAGFNRVDEVRGGKWSISLSKKGEGEDPEVVLATLDSGSPMFVETKEGWRLCGIASTASNRNNPGYGDRGNYARVDEAVEWLEQVMR